MRSIRTRIGLAMCLSAVLVVPVVVLALYYVSQMNSLATVIAESDVELLRLGSAIVHNLREIYRGESNYFLSGDTTYLRTAKLLIRQALWRSQQGRRLAPELRNVFDSLHFNLTSYAEQIESLPIIYTLTTRILPEGKLADLQERYQTLVEEAERAQEPTIQDSLLFLAEVTNREIEIGRLASAVRSAKRQRVQETFMQSIAEGERIISRANQRIAEHKGRISRLFAWSQRNIITAIIILTILLGYLLFRIPNSIVLPIKRIVNALNRAEQGDLALHITVNTSDELGNLAQQINRVFARLREFDQRKINYIAELEHRFRLLAGSIKEGVLVVDPTKKILYANPATEPLLEGKASEASGRPITEFPRVQVLLPYLEQVLSGVGSRQECEIIPELPSSAVCFEALRDHNGVVVAALVVITNPEVSS